MKKFLLLSIIFFFLLYPLYADRAEDSLIAQIEKWAAAGERDKALNKTYECLENKTIPVNNRDIFLLLGGRLEKSISKSISLLEEARDNYPESNVKPYIYFELGMRYYEKEDFNKSIDAFKEAVSLDINNTYNVKEESLYTIGLSYIELSDYKNAIYYFEELMKEFTGGKYYKEAILSLADINYKTNKLDKARITYHKYLVLYPNSRWVTWVYFQLYNIDNQIGFSEESDNMKDYLVNNYPYSQEAKTLSGKVTKIVQVNNVNKTDESNTDNNIERPVNTMSFSEGEYIIQIGSFRDMSRAEKLQKELKLKSIDNYIEPVSVRGETYYRVRVGYFISREEASRFMQDNNLEGWVFKK